MNQIITYNKLKNIKGKFLFSYDDNKEARQLFKDFKITTIATRYQGTQHIKNREKKEIVIQNY